MKICRICGMDLSLDNFPHRSTVKLRNECQKCLNEADRKRYIKNPHIRLAKKQYAECNKIKLKKYQQVYHAEPEVKERKKKYRLLEPYKLAVRKWREKNRKRLNKLHNEWYKNRCNDPVFYRKRQLFFQKYNKNRRNNPLYRLRLNLSRRIHLALCNGYAKKSEKFKDLIGCTPDELKRHLQTQFLPGMTWDNYGKWHVDHIVPCKRFNLLDLRERKVCFNFSNLQPLWAYDNLSKGTK